MGAWLSGMRYGGQPSANDIAKALGSDGIGPHEHGKFGPHQHGKPSLADDAVEYLQEKGYHIDRHHGLVYNKYGSPMTTANVAAILSHARSKGLVKGQAGSPVGASHTGGAVSGAVSGPSESGATVQYLDLRQQ